MKNLPLFILHLFIFFACLFMNSGELVGQELTEEEKAQKEFEYKYFGNEDYKKAAELFGTNETQKTREYLQKAAETFEQEKEWLGFIYANKDIIRTFQGTGDYEDVIERGKKAIEKIEREAPELAIKCYLIYRELGNIYVESGNLTVALEASETALKMMIQDSSNMNIPETKLANVYNDIGVVYAYSGNMDKTLEYFLKARDSDLSYSGINDCNECLGSLAATYGNLGTYYSITGNMDKSFEYGEKGIEITKRIEGENSLNLFKNYYNTGAHYRSLHEFETSINYFKKAISIIEKSGSTKEVYLYDLLPKAYMGLGEVYETSGQLEEALSYQNKAVAIFEEHRNNSNELVEALLEVSSVYLQKKDYELSLTYMNRVDSLFSLIEFDSNNVHEKNQILANIYLNQALLAEKKGDIDRAIEYSKLGFQLIDGLGKGKWMSGIATKVDISRLYEVKEQMDSAFFYNQEALISACFNFNSRDYFELPPPEEFKDFVEIYWVLEQKSELIRKSGLATEEQTQKAKLFSEAISVVDLADQVHVRNLKKMNTLRSAQSSRMVKNSIPVYQKGLSIAHEYSQITDSEEMLEKGFYYAQKMKAQTLWLTHLKSSASGFGNVDKALLEKERDLLSDINFYENLVFEARQNKDTATVKYYENGSLFSLRESYQAHLEKMETEYPEYYESKFSFVAETGESLQNILNEGELLIEYILTDSAVFAFTIAKDQPFKLEKINLNQYTEEIIHSLSRMLQNSAMMRKQSREKFIKMSNNLYNQFLLPIEDQLEGKQKIIVVGDGLTNYIPFEILLKSKEVKPFRELDFLIKKHEFSYHYSSTLFAQARRKIIPDNQGIYAFAPVYDGLDAEPVSMRNSEDAKMNLRFRAMTEDGNFSPLPESEVEVQSIFKLFNNSPKNNANILDLRENATEASLKKNLEKPYQFVHIAGHSFANLENPKFSGIACFESPDSDKEDGTLYTGEIYNISSKAGLVTLSSCESGYGKLETSEGILGLNRAFIYSGTPNVIFSLWKVYDKVSSNLMVDFYENVLEGKSYSESLRAAKLSLLNDEATAAPHYWSPYLLIGR